MSDNEVPNDATPEALDSAENAALGMDDGPAESVESGPTEMSSSASADGPSSGISEKSAQASVTGDAAMDALTGMAKGKTLAKQKAAMGAGVAAKGGSLAALVGSSIISGSMTLSAVQIGKIFLDAMADNYRVKQTGSAVSMKDKLRSDARLVKGQGRSSFKKARSNMVALHPRKAGNKNKGATEDRILASRGVKVADRNTGASIQNNAQAPSIFNKSKRQDMLLRIRRVQDYGDQGVQKDAKFAPKAMGTNGIKQTTAIRNDTMDKLAVNMYAMRPNMHAPAAPRM